MMRMSVITLALLVSYLPCSALVDDNSKLPAQISFDQVIKAANEVENPFFRGRLLVEIAATLAKRGQATKAEYFGK